MNRPPGDAAEVRAGGGAGARADRRPIGDAGRSCVAADGTIAEILLSVPAISIAGGTGEIQRSIIGERILGLPREPDPGRDLPFRRVQAGGT